MDATRVQVEKRLIVKVEPLFLERSQQFLINAAPLLEPLADFAREKSLTIAARILCLIDGGVGMAEKGWALVAVGWKGWRCQRSR